MQSLLLLLKYFLCNIFIQVVRSGPGGHKGVSSIIESLGHNGFARVKIGVGRPETGKAAEGYVLSRFAPEEEDLMKDVMEKASAAAETFVSFGVAAAQERFNRKDLNINEEVID